MEKNIINYLFKDWLREKRYSYFTPNEILQHSTPDDLWVSVHGHVYDLTPLCDEYKGSFLLKPILLMAGKDMSSWFDSKSGEIKTFVDVETNELAPFTPFGKFVDSHVGYSNSESGSDESSSEYSSFWLPWWKDERFLIGLVTKKPRKLHIVNMMVLKRNTIEVCCEDTINDILNRYLRYNPQAGNYSWVHMGKELDMGKTLDENGLTDNSELLERLKFNEDDFIPIIHLYFKDDL